MNQRVRIPISDICHQSTPSKKYPLADLSGSLRDTSNPASRIPSNTSSSSRPGNTLCQSNGPCKMWILRALREDLKSLPGNRRTDNPKKIPKSEGESPTRAKTFPMVLFAFFIAEPSFDNLSLPEEVGNPRKSSSQAFGYFFFLPKK